MDAVVRFSILPGVGRSGSCRSLALLPTQPPHSSRPLAAPGRAEQTQPAAWASVSVTPPQPSQQVCGPVRTFLS